jgi:hypothetical protein
LRCALPHPLTNAATTKPQTMNLILMSFSFL